MKIKLSALSFNNWQIIELYGCWVFYGEKIGLYYHNDAQNPFPHRFCMKQIEVLSYTLEWQCSTGLEHLKNLETQKKRQTAVQQAKISLQQSCTKALKKKSYMIYLRLLNLYMCDPCYHYSADVNLASFFHMWQNCIFKWLLVAFCISKQVKLEMLETKPKNYLGCIWEGCSNQSEVSVKIAAWSLH